MNKRYFIFTRKDPSQELMALVLTVLFFAVGCVVGTASASYITENSVVPNFISDIITSLNAGNNDNSSFLSILLDVSFYPLIVFAMGFFVFGFAMIPSLAAVRGYIYSFSVALLIRYYGISGVIPAFILFGIKSIVFIPCFVVLAVQAFSSSMKLTSTVVSRGASWTPPYGKRFVLRSVLCFIALALFALVLFLLSDKVFNAAIYLLQKT